MNSSISPSDKLLSVAVPRPLDVLFTYRISPEQADKVRVGGWVTVPFGRGRTHAYVVRQPQEIHELSADLPLEKLKSVLDVGTEETVIPEDVRRIIHWAHEYYHAPLGEIYQCAAPAAALGLRNRKLQARAIDLSVSINANDIIPAELNAAQSEAVEKIEVLRLGQQKQKTVLLNGVTGSGKTEVYLELARRVLAEQKNVLVLVPEIALTPQLHQRFESALGVKVGLWHSAVADGKRRDLWAAASQGHIRVIVGARSAVFAPIKNLGLIVVDEEHDSTYKQEDRFRYHARDLAIVRAQHCNALIVLGSATPSLESLENVRRGRYLEILLPQRYASGGMPEIEIVNLCEEEKVEGIQAPLAQKTLTAMQKVLDQGDQIMVFLNRRGFSAFILCEDCGEVHGCPNCSVSLTFHKYRRKLQCHFCNFEEPAPTICRKCQSDHLRPMGAGTESLAEELPRLLPQMNALRLDRDQVTSTQRLSQILDDFRAGKANALLGTQMLVKGHDFPDVTLVVVILADSLFRWPDYRATEKAFQILTQVSGRAGRGQKPGRVMIQTYAPEHPVLQLIAGQSKLSDFLQLEREIRESFNYPPFSRLARLRIEHSDRDQAVRAAKKVGEFLMSQCQPDNVSILGPSEAFLEKKKGLFRWDLLIKAKTVQDLSILLKSARQFSQFHHLDVMIDVDPSGIG